MKKILDSKTILFIAPIFYGYEKIIASKLEELGAFVIYYPERKNDIKYKYVNNFKNEMLGEYQENHYSRIYESVKNTRIDYLFIIRGYLMPKSFIQKIRSQYPNAILIMHQWDSMKNYNYETSINLFDKTFSFDPADCNTYPMLQYLPNFYLPEYAYLKNNRKKNIYDISFIGWANEDRVRILEKISSQLPQKNIFQYCYTPFGRHFMNILRRKSYQKIKTKLLSLSEACKIIHQSFSILDITDINQTGYTYRSIDAIAAGKKLITTNPFIQYEKFYDARNILIIDRNNPNIDSGFFETPFVETDIKNYSLDNWIQKIFV